ncbi:MAG: WecB/TagA/CpsF family glycosyltransferase [Candidatus Shapirobacteria bacterium]|jgi:N-acetylglucosaminyldiphosphoundecaprenol N-acetyl-beta-D-mannosaminyltransferase|nr:WecB/TagA/CpsF family glycosyltransferase [Candidatus Shapirobacteria bacterium]
MKKYRPKKQTNKALTSKKVDVVNGIKDGMYWQIYDINLFSRDKSRVLNVLEKKLASGTKKYWIATVNPEFVMTAQKDEEFKKILSKTSLNVVDGIGLIWARELEKRFKKQDLRFMNKTRKSLLGFMTGVEVLRGKYKDQVASGADLIIDLVKMAQKTDKKIFLLGGWGERAQKMAEFLMTNYQISNKNIEWSEGEPNVANSQVVKKINKFKPDILLVAYGMKKQEFWIDKNLKVIDVGLVMGVGRSFDYYSGELKRAPFWVRKTGLEWLYSLIKEPKRFKRQLVLPKFILRVLYN